ncbi:cation-dependent mannose-6-phosphate receptor-like [Palaemon carinicauda]|uniref:cation-dependent mannose-6-phosphate receptor-like n=1 Tax=Palaemon carinicauda TaxID=392227 RepID=UPI0035B5A8FE
MKMVFFGPLVIVMICVITLTGATCTINQSVKNETEIAKQLKLLQTLDPIVGKKSQQLKTVNGYMYDFVVCGDVDEKHTGASIIQTSPSKQTKVLGYNNQSLVYSKGNWLMLTLQGGDSYNNNTCNSSQREAHILFVCDPFQKEVQIQAPQELTDTSCYLQFIVPNKVICPKAPDEGLSGGAIFFILLFVTFGAYFTFGFFYLRLVKGAKGIEQIPNVEFWFRLGNILADGCGAICRCDQYCGNASVSASTPTTYNGYSPIEERLARDLQDTDRDSALLSP